MVLRQPRQASGRIYHAGCANYQTNVARIGRLFSTVVRDQRQLLAKPHHARAQHRATRRTTRRPARLGGGDIAFAAATQPLVGKQVAVQLDHPFAAGALMQTVDVLRDERHRLALG